MPKDDQAVHTKCVAAYMTGAAGQMAGRPDRTRLASALAFLVVPLKLAADRACLFQQKI